jgi:hypothetical protein
MLACYAVHRDAHCGRVCSSQAGSNFTLLEQIAAYWGPYSESSRRTLAKERPYP